MTIVRGTAFGWTQETTASISRPVGLNMVQETTGSSGVSSYLISIGGFIAAYSPLSKLTTKATPLVGSLTPSATLANGLVFVRSYASSITMSGSMSRVLSLSRAFGGTLTAAGVIKRSTIRVVSGTITGSGNALRTVTKGLQGVLTGSATFVSSFVTQRLLGGSTQASGNPNPSYQPYVPPTIGDDPSNNLNFLRRFLGRR